MAMRLWDSSTDPAAALTPVRETIASVRSVQTPVAES